MAEQSVSGIIVAAGSASRMGGVDKQLLRVGGIPAVVRSLLLFDRIEEIIEMILVVRKDRLDDMKSLCEEYTFHKDIKFIPGGDTRQESVKNGVLASSPASSYLAIHDGARPLCREEDVRQVVSCAKKYGAAALGVPSKDTVKITDEHCFVLSTPERSRVWQIQTPQVFSKSLYEKALQKASAEGQDYTDDCQLIESTGTPVYIVRGSYENIKITTPEDHLIAQVLENGGRKNMRIGHGYDVHRLTENRKLILGGVEIPHFLGLLGHSDADVLLHAVTDALLGAAALGDIGKHFPDTDPAYKGADSRKLLSHAVSLLERQGYRIVNIDATVIAQKPKLAPYINTMRENIAAACRIPPESVNVKATTEEKLGFTGAEQGISAHAVALIEN